MALSLSKPRQTVDADREMILNATITRTCVRRKDTTGNVVAIFTITPDPVVKNGQKFVPVFDRQDRNGNPLKMSDLVEAKTFVVDGMRPGQTDAEKPGATRAAENFFNEILNATDFPKKLGKTIRISPEMVQANTNDVCELEEEFLMTVDDDVLNEDGDYDPALELCEGSANNLAKICAATVGSRIKIKVEKNNSNQHVIHSVYHPSTVIAGVAGLKALRSTMTTVRNRHQEPTPSEDPSHAEEQINDAHIHDEEGPF